MGGWWVRLLGADQWGEKALAFVVSSPQIQAFNPRIEPLLPGIVEVILDWFNVEGFADFLDRST
jgi:hypothetical protein